MAARFPCAGLYGINREEDRGPDLEQALERAVRGGLAVFQYRRKAADATAEREVEAARLLQICRRFGIPMIVNDDADLAVRLGADGVHLGRDDASVSSARAKLGAHAVIGVSCYDSVPRALAAEREGADYVAFGRFFPSRSKPLATPAHLETLTEAQRRIKLPIVAIGGITPENGGRLLDAGAGLLAAIDAVFGAGDPSIAAAAFRPLFNRHGGFDP